MELPSERPGKPAPADLLAARGRLDAAVGAGVFAVDSPAEAILLGPVPALRFAPPGEARATVLHFHGGGFRLGRPEQGAPFAAALARAAEVTVVCPRYRLAPEWPFPAALSDARRSLSALQQGGETCIVLSGDSAGGGIAAGLAALSVTDAVRPAALLLLSPWLDLTQSDSAFATNAGSDPLFSRAAANMAAALYLQGTAPDHPLASPLLGSVGGYPPTFLNVGSGEVLRGDTQRFHAVLAAAGVPTQLQVVSGMEHVAVTRGIDLDGAAETFAAMVTFIDEVLAGHLS